MGTMRQGNAGAVLQAYSLNGAMDGCLATKGYPEWDWSQHRNYAPPLDPMGTSTFFAQPMSRTFSETTMALKPKMEAAEKEGSATLSKAETKAVDTCLGTTKHVGDDEASRVSRPSGTAELRDAWWAMLADLDTRYGDGKAYNQCLDKAGISLLQETGQPAEELHVAMSSLTPSAEFIPTSAADPIAANPRWQHLLAVEKEVQTAEWSCRSDIYNSHLPDALAAVQQFAAEHTEQISKARQGWEEIEAAAAKLGYTGQAGPLGR